VPNAVLNVVVVSMTLDVDPEVLNPVSVNFDVEFVVDLLVSNIETNTVIVLNAVLNAVEVPKNVEYVVEVLVKVNLEVPVNFEVPVKVLLLTSLVRRTGSPDTVVVISVLYVVVVETSFDV
jgi:hypothetical protein